MSLESGLEKKTTSRGNDMRRPRGKGEGTVSLGQNQTLPDWFTKQNDSAGCFCDCIIKVQEVSSLVF